MDSEQVNNRLELTGAIIMSLAALLTAWCGFQSSRWGSIQSVQLAEANLKNSAAMERSLDFNQHYGMDGIIVLNIVNATFDHRQSLVDFYLGRLRPELARVISKWLESKPLENQQAYASPMVMPEYLEIIKKGRAESVKLRKEAESSRAEALYADRISDNYLLLTILFSAIMFLGGIESKFDVIKIRLMLLSLSVILFLYSAFRMWQLPLAVVE